MIDGDIRENPAVKLAESLNLAKLSDNEYFAAVRALTGQTRVGDRHLLERAGERQKTKH